MQLLLFYALAHLSLLLFLLLAQLRQLLPVFPQLCLELLVLNLQNRLFLVTRLQFPQQCLLRLFLYLFPRLLLPLMLLVDLPYIPQHFPQFMRNLLIALPEGGEAILDKKNGLVCDRGRELRGIGDHRIILLQGMQPFIAFLLEQGDLGLGALQAIAILPRGHKGLVPHLEQIMVGHEAIAIDLDLSSLHFLNINDLIYTVTIQSSPQPTREIQLEYKSTYIGHYYHRHKSFITMAYYDKVVLRGIESRRVQDYLTPPGERTRLGYPRNCLEEPGSVEGKEMISIGMRKIAPEIKRNYSECLFVSLVLCNSHLEVVFEEKLPLNGEQIMRDPIYSNTRKKLIRLIDNKILVGYDMGQMMSSLNIEHQYFIDIVHLYPHGLGLPYKTKLENLAFQILDIKIEEDEDDIYYRRRGGRRYYGRRRIWGNGGLQYDSQDDFDSDRRYNEDSGEEKDKREKLITTNNVCLRLAEDYIAKGSGVFTNVYSEKKDLSDIDRMLEEAELDRKKVIGLFLRGSRAAGVQIQSEQYFSDWDYVCVLDTWATIYCSLIKLNNVDIILFDRRTFEAYISANDLPMVELFYLPNHCTIINTISRPFIDLLNLKKSLVYNIKVADNKILFYGQQFVEHFILPARKNQPNGSKNRKKNMDMDRNRDEQRRRGRDRRGYRIDYREDQIDPRSKGFRHELLSENNSQDKPMSSHIKMRPQYVKWKLLKLVHLQIRMVDEYLQFKEFSCIKDIQRVTPIWNDLKIVCQEQGYNQGYQFLKKRLNEMLHDVFNYQELFYFQFTLWKDLQNQYEEQENRRHGGFSGYRRRRRIGRRGFRSERQVPEMGEGTLSIYKSNIFQSSQQIAPFYRIKDVTAEEKLDQKITELQSYNPEESVRQLVKFSAELAKKDQLKLIEFMIEHKRLGQRSFQYLLTPYFIIPQYFFENTCLYSQAEESDVKVETLCLNNFILEQHANLENRLVQEAKAAIFKSSSIMIKDRTLVRTLVCLNYLPFLQLSSHFDANKFEEEGFDIEVKRDGVMASLYCVNDRWFVASKYTVDGREFITKESNVTFRTQFLRIFNQIRYKFPESQDKNKAFFFEMLSTNIPNILAKEKDELFLHGARNMVSLLQESPRQYAEKYGWEVVKTQELSNNINEIVEIAQKRVDFQGFILKGKNFNRLIIRNSSYLKKKWEREFKQLQEKPQLSYFNEKIEANKLVYYIYSQIVLKGKGEIYSRLFPQNAKLVQSIQSYIKEVNEQAQAVCQQIEGLNVQSIQCNEIIKKKRADIIEYSFSYFNRNFPELYKHGIHTSTTIDKTFDFLLQHLNHFSSQ